MLLNAFHESFLIYNNSRYFTCSDKAASIFGRDIEDQAATVDLLEGRIRGDGLSDATWMKVVEADIEANGGVPLVEHIGDSGQRRLFAQCDKSRCAEHRDASALHC